MIIRILNRQKRLRPNALRIRELAGFFARKAAPDSRWTDLSVVLTGDGAARALKRRFFGLDAVTDVVSFTARPEPGGPRGLSAEVIVNIEEACRQGPRRGGMEREFALYLAHGCDHAAGRSDRTATARAGMRRRELLWLREAAAKKMLSGLFRTAHESRQTAMIPVRRPTTHDR